jgi:hypothetical protein
MWLLARLQRYWPELLGMLLALAAQIQLGWWLLKGPRVERSAVLRRTVKVAVLLASVWVLLGFFFSIQRMARWLPPSPGVVWLRGLALAWAMISVGEVAIWFLWRRAPQYDPGRRRLLRAAGGVLAAAPIAGLGFGILVQRTDLRVREVKVLVGGLPKDFQGLRLVHLSDIHLGAFLSERELERVVGVANELRGHVAVITGDLVSWRVEALDACLGRLAKLRAEAGIFGCMGNHEAYFNGESYAALKGASVGVEFLRQRSHRLRFGSGILNLVGVDYQSQRRPYLAGAQRWVEPGALNVLLCHNPDVFPVAARQGYQLTLAGHTHGGQLVLELFNQPLCAARFYTPFVYGLYRRGPASIYVTRGIGTVGIPARLGAPPEVALIRLCAT